MGKRRHTGSKVGLSREPRPPKNFRELLLIVIVMGVTGAGKSTVGSMLATELGWQFADADSFHSLSNKKKIARGIGLDDDDRAPWLAAIRTAMMQWTFRGLSAVLACSALKRSYREFLRTGPGVKFVYLKGSYEDIYRRLTARPGHFATETILKSQFDALEEPDDAVTVEINKPPKQIVSEIIKGLGVVPSNLA